MKKIFSLKFLVMMFITMLFASVTCAYAYSSYGITVPLGKTKFNHNRYSLLMLNNGKILISEFPKKCELFNPKTKKFESMAQPNYFHSDYSKPVLLDNGRVFVVGATYGPFIANKKYLTPDRMSAYQKELEVCEQSQYAEIYDPLKNEWKVSGKMVIPRSGFGITKLQDGRILITNGSVAGPLAFYPDGKWYNPLRIKFPDPESNAEIFDPKTETFSLAGKSAIKVMRKDITNNNYLYRASDIGSPTVLLDNGEVLVLWLFDGFAEVYNPQTNIFRQVGNLQIKRSSNHIKPFAFKLKDGRVFIVGGDYSNVVEIYDPKTETFKNYGTHSANAGYLLKDGRVLLIGGALIDRSRLCEYRAVNLHGVEIFDPKTDTFKKTGKIYQKYSGYGYGGIVLENGNRFLVKQFRFDQYYTCTYGVIFIPNYRRLR